jgi:hypothetical protein
MKSLALALAILFAACAPLSTVPPAEATTGEVRFGAERVSAGLVRLTLDNGAPHPIGYNLCTSELERREGSAWTRVATGEMCTMQLLSLNPGADATFEKQLPADLAAGEYRYQTSIESPLGTAQKKISTAPFTK